MNEDQVCNAALIVDVETQTGECRECGCHDFGADWDIEKEIWAIYCKQCNNVIYMGLL